LFAGYLGFGVAFSFVRQDVFQQTQTLGLPCFIEAANHIIHTASGQSCATEQVISLQIKLHSFSWKYTFFTLDDSPVPCILGADFLSFAKMQLDFASSSYFFAFPRSCRYDVESLDLSKQHSVFPCSEKALKQLAI
jgi:hypothetical protein